MHRFGIKFAAIVASAVAFGATVQSVNAQFTYQVGGVIPTATTPGAPVAAPTFVIPPQANVSAPIQTTSISPVTTIVAPAQTLPSAIVVPILPTDITNENQVLPRGPVQGNVALAMRGIKEVSASKMDALGEGQGEMIVKGDDETMYNRDSRTHVTLMQGSILVSVRTPAKYGVVETPNGFISLNSDGEILVSFVEGILRVDNISSQGHRCQVTLDGKEVLDGAKSRTVALAAGYELVAADRTLHAGDIRPADGISRRKSSTLENGHLAVSEFRPTTFLTSSTIVASIRKSNDGKDGRILDGMCKMAAVLDYVHGRGGYTQAGSTGIAVKPGATTK